MCASDVHLSPVWALHHTLACCGLCHMWGTISQSNGDAQVLEGWEGSK